MSLDYTKLDQYVERFRKGSPNIAAAFDEVKGLLGDLHPTVNVNVTAPESATISAPVGEADAMARNVTVVMGTTVVTPPEQPGGGGTTSEFPIAPSRPAFTPTRTVNVTSKATLDSAISGMQAGDKIVVTSPFTYTGQLSIFNKQPASTVEIHLSGVTFTGSTSTNVSHAVALSACRNLRIYDGNVSNALGNVGIWVQDSNNCTWWGHYVSGCAGMGVILQGIGATQSGLDFRGRVTNCGLDYLRLDPHAEKGTGIHGVYMGGGSFTTGGTFVYEVWDQHTGAAIQAGAYANNCDVWLKATNITFNATSQVAGNAFQLWGNTANYNVKYLLANNVARAVEANGMYGTNNPTIVIEYARTTNARKSPAYVTGYGITYQDVS